MAKNSDPHIVEDDPRAYAVTRNTAVLARKVWAQPLWRGIIAAAAGACLLIWPTTALSWVLWGVLGLLVIDAIITLIAAVTSEREKSSRVAVSLLAIGGVLAAAAAVIWTDTTSELLRYALAVTVVVGGLITVIGSIRERQGEAEATWALRLSAGVMSVLFGAIVLLHHDAPAEQFSSIVATFFIMFAVVQINIWYARAVQRRQLKKQQKQAS